MNFFHVNLSFTESDLLLETRKMSTVHSLTPGHIILTYAPLFMIKLQCHFPRKVGNKMRMWLS